MAITLKQVPQTTASKSTEAPQLSPGQRPAEIEQEQLDRFQQWRERWQHPPRALCDRLAALGGLLDELSDASGVPKDRRH